VNRQTSVANRVSRKPVRSRPSGDQLQRVMRELDAVTRDDHGQADPIVEQLEQCPEAFKAGEMIDAMLDALKYRQDDKGAGDRLLPPAGAVIPPLV
jgi:hypothetical protein